MTIRLNNLRFFAYHGLFPEEKKTGNQFKVDMAIDYPDARIITGLNETINYADLFNLVKLEMQKPRDLLETLAMEMAQAIHNSWEHASRVEITITKIQPPITGFTGTAGITYWREFN